MRYVVIFVAVRQPTAATLRLCAALTRNRGRISEVLDRYGATDPRLFGSVARGEASDDGDVDLLVESIAGLRNVVVHEYFRVDPGLIRDIVDNQLAPLLDDLR